jgi:hypothetical protein
MKDEKHGPYDGAFYCESYFLLSCFIVLSITREFQCCSEERQKSMKKIAVSLVTTLLLAIPVLAQVREFVSPGGQGSGQPNLTVSSDGRVYLSWIERHAEGKVSLRFSTLEKGAWTTPGVIAEGANWFVNWADFPSMIALPDGSLAAHWLVKSGAGTFEYRARLHRLFPDPAPPARTGSGKDRPRRRISPIRIVPTPGMLTCRQDFPPVPGERPTMHGSLTILVVSCEFLGNSLRHSESGILDKKRLNRKRF